MAVGGVTCQPLPCDPGGIHLTFLDCMPSEGGVHLTFMDCMPSEGGVHLTFMECMANAYGGHIHLTAMGFFLAVTQAMAMQLAGVHQPHIQPSVPGGHIDIDG